MSKALSAFEQAELQEENARLKQERDELAAQVEVMREALQFYADSSHFTVHQDVWESVSGEPENFLEDENNTATVEDGSIARVALSTTQSAALQAHDNEVAAKALEEAADESYGINRILTSADLRRMATERRNRK